MLLLDLFEAPIGNLEVHNMEEPGTFPSSDRRLLNTPQHIEKIKKHFSGTDNLFDFYFINRADRQYTRPGYDEASTMFSKEWNDDIDAIAGATTPEEVFAATGVRITPDPEAISVVFFSNANTQGTVSMTPWIIAHRFGHALTDRKENLPADIQGWLSKIPSIYDAIAKSGSKRLYLRQVLTMRSARTDTLNSGEELEELIAQYLIAGDVRLAVPDYVVQQVDPEVAQDLQRQLFAVGQRMRVTIGNLLDSCVGLLLVAV